MKKRVVLFYHGSLLTQGIQAFLEAATDYDIIGIDVDEGEIERRLPSLEISAIVVDSDDVAMQHPFLFHLLDAIPNLKVVCLHSGRTFADVYQKNSVPVRRANDVAEALAAG